MEDHRLLRRYTNLPAAVDLLVRRRMVLGGYAHWVDANDRRALALYQEALHYGFVGAMCLTLAAETFHHWEVFANGSAGVCIVFNRHVFEHAFSERPHFVSRPVKYVRLSRIDTIEATDIHQLPFLKREGFRDEREYRLLGYAVEQASSISTPVSRDMIERVVISPFVHRDHFDSIRSVLGRIEGWHDLPVVRSKLTDNETWQAALGDFVRRHGIVYGPWQAVDPDWPNPND